MESGFDAPRFGNYGDGNTRGGDSLEFFAGFGHRETAVVGAVLGNFRRKDWSVNYNVPIFLGEFGSFSKLPTIEDRCRHAETVYSALGKLNIPNAGWEWDGGFNVFEKSTTRIAPCMRKAIDSYNAGK